MLCKTNAGGGGGGGQTAFAYIIANYPSGATCIASNGVITLQSLTGNARPAIFGIPEPLSLPESWTVLATNGTSTRSQSVTITAQYQVEEVTITFSLLPIEYQEVEYLESTGTQYIDLGIHAESAATTEYDIVFMMLTDLQHSVMGYAIRSGNNTYGQDGLIYKTAYYTDTPNLGYYFAESIQPLYLQNDISLNTKYTVKFNTSAHKLNINGTDVETCTSESRTSNYNMILFGHMWQGDTVTPQGLGNTRIYSFVKKNNSTNVKSIDLVPCYRKEDEVAGFYDMVDHDFYTNAGTGTFVVGPNL